MDLSLTEHLITTKSASELSGYSADYLARLIRGEKIIGKKVGHTWMVDSVSLERFLGAQQSQKLDRSRELAQARVKEYHANQRFIHRVKRDLTKRTKELRMPESVVRPASLQTHVFALAIAVGVVAGATSLAQASAIGHLSTTAASVAQNVLYGFNETFGRVPARIAADFREVKNEMYAKPQEVAMRSVLVTARAASPVLAEPDLAFMQMHIDCANVSCARVAYSPRALTPKSGDVTVDLQDLSTDVSRAFAFVTSPHEIRDALVHAYVAAGMFGYNTTQAALSGYRTLIELAGAKTFDTAVRSRDSLAHDAPRALAQAGTKFVGVTHALIRADVAIAYGIAHLAPASARATVTTIGTVGAVLAEGTSLLPGHVAGAYLALTEAPARVAPELAAAVFGAEYKAAEPFVRVARSVSDSYLASIRSAGTVAYEGGVVASRAVSVAQSLGKDAYVAVASALESAPSAIQDAYLGTLGRTALALETFVHSVPMLAAASSALSVDLSFPEQVAVSTYATIQSLFTSATNSLASLFLPAPTIVVSNTVPARTMPTVATSSTARSVTYSSPTYTTVVQGISPSVLDASLATLRGNILGTVASMIQPVAAQTATNITTIQQVNRIEQLHDLVVTKGDFRNSIFDSGIRVAATDGSFTNLSVTNFTAGASNLSSTTVTGNLTATGGFTSYTSATAPYFVATSTSATSTYAGGLAVGTNNFLVDYSTGRVGIGTTSPLSKFVVSGGASIGADYNVAAPTNGLLVQGNVGIGTTSPTNALHIVGNTASQLKIESTSASSTAALSFTNDAQNWQMGTFGNAANSLILKNITSGASSFAVSTADKIGIGTTTPTHILTIAKSSNSNESVNFPTVKVINTLTTKGDGVTTWNDAEFKVSAGNDAVIGGIWAEYTDLLTGFQVGTADANPVNIVVGDLPKVTVLYSGNMGIGTTSPYRRFSVAGSGVFSGGDVLASTLNATSTITSLATTTATHFAASELGFAGAPAFTFSNDLDTGFWSSIANTLNFSTGGSERMRVDSSGNVGVGTTSPWGLLSVNPNGITGPAFVVGSSTATNFIVTNAGNVGIGTTSPSSALALSGDFMLTGTTTITGAGKGIIFTGTGNHDITAANGTLRIGSNTVIGNIEALDDTVDIGTPSTRFDKIYANEVNASTIVGTLSAGNLIADTFNINSDNATADTENAYLSFERGSVSPNALLTWNSAGSAKRFEMNQPLFIQSADASTTLPTFTVKSVASQTADVFQVASTSGAMFFNVSGAGNVGIGTTSPYRTLSVQGSGVFTGGDVLSSTLTATSTITSSATTTATHFAASTLGFAGAPAFTFSNDLDTGFWSSIANTLNFSTAGSERARFDSSGNFGIGTTSPWGLLSVNPNGITGPAFVVGSSTATRFMVSNAGNVGIGTTSPDSLLNIYGNAADTVARVWSGSATKYVDIELGRTAWDAAFAVAGGDAQHSTDAVAGDVILKSNTGKLFLQTGSAAAAIAISSNNVGIGTSTPTTKLTVYGTSPTGTTDSQISVIGSENTGAAGTGGGLTFFGYDGSSGPRGWGAIQGLKENSTVGNVNSYLAFSTREHPSGLAEKMRITSTGNVGIGTSTPAQKLSVVSSDSSYGMLRVNNSSASEAEATIGFFGTSGNDTNDAWIIGAGGWSNTGDFVIGNENNGGGGNARLLIEKSGNVGIGTTSPWGLLSVNPNGISGPAFVVGSSTATQFIVTNAGNIGAGTTTPGGKLDVFQSTGLDYFRISRAGLHTWGLSSSNNGTRDTLLFVNNTDSTNPMAIDSSGNVGIGATSPVASLTVDSANTALGTWSQFAVRSTDSFAVDKGGSMVFGGKYNTGGSYVDFANIAGRKENSTDGNIAGYLQFSTAPSGGSAATEKMRITSAGNVGIGTTTPSTKLHVWNSAASLAAGTSGTLKLQETATGIGSAITFAAVADNGGLGNQGSIMFRAGSTGTASDNRLSFAAETQDTLREDLVILGSGKVGIGTTSPLATLSVYSANAAVADGAPTTGAYIYTSDAIAADIGGKISFGAVSTNAGDVNATAAIAGRRENATSANYAGYLQFATMDSTGVMAERMRVSSAGNVGIGATPNTWYSGTKALEIGATTALMDISGQTNLYQNAYLNAAGNLIYKTTGYATQYRSLSGEHQFFVAASGTAGNTITFTQAMTVANSGYVGIGTTAPITLLANTPTATDDGVTGATANSLTWAISGTGPVATFYNGNNAINSTGLLVKTLYTGSSGSTNYIFNAVSGTGASGGTSRFYVRADGNVGIGTTAPVNKFEIANTLASPSTSGSAANGFQRLVDSAGSRVLDFGLMDSPSMAWLQSRDKNDYSVNYPLTLNPNGGNVGIGTTTPGYKLDVQGTSDVAARIYTGTSNGSASLRFADNATDKWIIGTNQLVSGSAFEFRDVSSGLDRMVIQSGGNIGIGTTTPAEKLDLRDGNFVLTDADVAHGITDDLGDTAAFGRFKAVSSTAGGLFVQGASDSTGTSGLLLIGYGQSGLTAPAVHIAGLKKSGSGATALSGTDPLLRVSPDGSTSRFEILGNGNVGVGTTTPGYTFTVNGGSAFISDSNVSGYETDPGTHKFFSSNSANNTAVVISQQRYNQTALLIDNIQSGATGDLIYGKVNGSNVFTVNVSGGAYFGSSVGIGTASPGTKLHVSDASGAIGGTANVFISTTDSQAIDKGGYLQFGGAYTGTTATSFAGISGRKENGTDGNYAGYLALSTRANGSTDAERMRITSAGKVGIGDTDPAKTLTVTETNNTAASSDTFWAASYGGALIRNPSNTANTVTGLAFYGGTANSSISGIGNVQESTSLGALAFFTGGSGIGGATTHVPERMRITSSGIVGIGSGAINAYDGQFNIQNQGSETNFLTAGTPDFSPNAAGTQLLMGFGATSGSTYASINVLWKGNVAQNNLILMPDGGNVGIGTTDPTTPLDGATGLTIYHATTPGFTLQNASRGYEQYVTGTTLRWWDSTANADRMTLDSSGNLGIGTSGPLNKLAVIGGTVGISGNGNGDGASGPSLPSTAHAYSSQLRLGLRGSIRTSDNAALTAVGTYLSDNAFFRNTSGNPGYIATAAASEVALIAGAVHLRYAASGTSDTDITWTNGLTMSNAGAVSIPTTGIRQLTAGDTAGGNNFISVRSSGGSLSMWAGGGTGLISTGNLTFYANETYASEAFSAKMTLDTDGDLGIGVTSPETPLDVRNSSVSSVTLANFVATSLNTGNFAQMRLGGALSAGNAVELRSYYAGSNSSSNRFDIAWYGNSTPVMSVLKGGTIGLGTTTPATTAHVHGTLTVDALGQSINNYTEGIRIGPSTGGYAIVAFGVNPNTDRGSITNQWWAGKDGSDNGFTIFGQNPGLNVMHITTSGYTTFGTSGVTDGNVLTLTDANGSCTHNPGSSSESVSCSSDERLKNSIEDTNVNGLNYLAGFRIRDFKLNSDGSEYTGVVAQEVMVAHPDLVQLGDDGMYKVTSANSWIVIKAIQELNARTAGITTLSSGSIFAASYEVASSTSLGYTLGDTVTIAVMPDVVLSTNGAVDLYKLATYTLSGVTAVAEKVSTLEGRMATLEDRLTALESGAVSSGSSSPLSIGTSSLASALNSFGVLIQNGIAQFNTLVFRQLVASKDADGTSSAGSVTILSGNTVAQVNNSLVKATTKVFVTFNSQIAGSWWVSDKADGSFRVVLSEAQSGDVSFDYFLVQTEGQLAESSPDGVVGTGGPSVSQSSGPDVVAPVLTLLGDNPVHLSVGGTYVEPGVTATDNVDGTMTITTFVDGIQEEATADTIDTSTEVTHIITYSATDSAGNNATVTRSVIVGAASSDTGSGSSTPSGSSDTTAPVVTLLGDAAMELVVGDTFTDPGASATDDTDGDLTASIVVTGSVDTATEGLYTLTYSATDAAGNTGSVSRVVTVSAAPAAS